VLAVIGDAEGRARQHRIGLPRAVGGEDGGLGRADRIHDGGKKIDDCYIDGDLLAGVMVAQKVRQLVHRHRDRAEIVAVGPVEALAGMRIGEPEAPQRRRLSPSSERGRQQSACERKEKPSVHRPALKRNAQAKGRPQPGAIVALGELQPKGTITCGLRGARAQNLLS
jgi:hypothetical protein